jgi:hypothetical protein
MIRCVPAIGFLTRRRALERDGAPQLRGEAVCAALLAEAVAATAAAVIAGNAATAG